MEIEPDTFRRVLGHLPTGVTVLTAFGPDGPVGMAANSVTSVSLEPPLVLACPAKSSATWPIIRTVGTFCINVMAGHHEQAARRFAALDVDRFAGTAMHERHAGPALDDAIAWVDCELTAEHDAGDHTIAVCRVLSLEAAAGADLPPLVFFRGRYGTFGESG